MVSRRILKLVSGQHSSSRRRFVELLDSQVDATQRALAVVESVLSGHQGWTKARETIASIEHEGDSARHLLVQELSRSLVTPIDREDVFRVSRSIDDVLDNLRDFVREGELFCLKDPSLFAPLVETVGTGLGLLRDAIGTMSSDMSRIGTLAVAAKKAGGQVRRRYQDRLADLYESELSTEVMKARDLLRRLDVVGLRLNEAADALADAAVKRSES
jgi:hypothetical protein